MSTAMNSTPSVPNVTAAIDPPSFGYNTQKSGENDRNITPTAISLLPDVAIVRDFSNDLRAEFDLAVGES